MSAKCYFFTGLSGSGKTTIAKELNDRIHAVWFDGDEVRETPLVEDPNDFSTTARKKHIRRLGYIASMFIEQNINVIISCIAPNRSVRNEVRTYFKPGQFIEIYVKTPLEICEQRDPKGLYKNAREGYINDFTGISQRYEEPNNPEFVIDHETIEDIYKNSQQKFISLILNEIKIMELIESDKPKMLLVGRFMPFHKGHVELINEAMKTHNVIIGIKFTHTNINNPYTPNQIKKMIRAVYPDIEIQVIPDFDFIGHGRNTGYSMKMIDIEHKIKKISATEVRYKIKNNDNSWKQLVQSQVIPIIEELNK